MPRESGGEPEETLGLRRRIVGGVVRRGRVVRRRRVVRRIRRRRRRRSRRRAVATRLLLFLGLVMDLLLVLGLGLLAAGFAANDGIEVLNAGRGELRQSAHGVCHRLDPSLGGSSGVGGTAQRAPTRIARRTPFPTMIPAGTEIPKQTAVTMDVGKNSALTILRNEYHLCKNYQM